MGWRETESGLLVPDTLELPEDEPVAGVCTYCGCTEDDPCLQPNTAGDDVACAWADETRTVCSACAYDEPAYDEDEL